MPNDMPAIVSLAGGVELGIWCSGEESLRVTSRSGDADAALAIAGRFVDAESGDIKPLQERHVPNTDRTAATSDHALGVGWLRSLTVIASSGAPTFAHTFVAVDLIRGRGNSATVLQTLILGPVSANARRAWPGSPLIASIEGPGALRSVLGTNPAAGVSISETVPTGARWRLLSMSFELVTAVAAADREVAIVIDDGATVLFTSPSGFTQTASLTRRYSASIVGAAVAPTQGTDRQIIIPDLWLPAGARIRTVTTNIQAGDDYGAPQLLVEEHLEAA